MWVLIAAVIIVALLIILVLISQGPGVSEEETQNLITIRQVTSNDNIGVKLEPREDYSGFTSAQYMYSNILSASGMEVWNSETKLKACLSYKTNQEYKNFRSGIIYAESPLLNNYEFQIDFYENLDEYGCSKWSTGSGGVYQISVPFNDTTDYDESQIELCINDINAILKNCASEWGVSEDEAYLTEIYQFYVTSPSQSIDEYVIYDYFRLYINDELEEEFEFSDLRGEKDDDEADFYYNWEPYYDAYKVSI